MAVAQVVNVGVQANDATGDLLRDAFTKINNNFSALFAGNFPAAQLTVGPPVSGNALTAIGISGSAAIVATAFSVTDISLTASGTASFAGGVTFGSPTGGNKGAGSFNAASGFINNVPVLTTAVTSIAGTANQIAVSASTGSVTASIPANVIIPTPSSGTALTVNGGGGGTALIANGAVGAFTAFFTANASGGNSLGLLVRAGTTSGDTAALIQNQTGSATFFNIAGDGHGTLGPSATTGLSWNASGDIVIPAPGAGDALTVTNVAGANALTIVGNSAGTAVIRLNTQATTGVQTATFTATNKPGSGTTGPDKWIPFNLDGTVHYVPAFL